MTIESTVQPDQSKEPKKLTTVRVTQEVHDKILERAFSESTPKKHVTGSDVMRDALDAYLS